MLKVDRAITITTTTTGDATKMWDDFWSFSEIFS